ncbi:MAG: endolytic transglycosylase MltG [Patescibacteria group bacterium]|nr:endolytic transglycosylase MltG [Patescibacteria group bacterium]MBU1953182.1 endolytic transglycosylase MltG [Patescibacteria group bacterium]
MVDELDPTKYHVLTPKKKRIILTWLLFFFLVIVPTLFFFYYNVAINRPSQTDKEITVEIGSGNSVFEIASTLGDRGAINSPFLFVLHVFLNRSELSIQAGTYTIKAGTPLVELVKQLSHGTNDITVTFIEGWRAEEFARLATKRLPKIDYPSFVNAASGLEGYLFPDTYFINKDSNEEELVKLLKDTFDQKTAEVLTEENIRKSRFNKEQLVTLASIVEREVSSEADRPIVAGILIKRLREGVKLDADATVQYAVSLTRLCKGNGYCIPTLEQYLELNWWPNDLTSEELKVDSPYNTREKAGLPPTPISSVSLSSLKAVVEPQPTPYYFYLTDTSGVTHYAKTLVEHNVNITKYLYK